MRMFFQKKKKEEKAGYAHRLLQRRRIMCHCTAERARNVIVEDQVDPVCVSSDGLGAGEKFTRDDQTLNLWCTFINLRTTRISASIKYTAQTTYLEDFCISHQLLDRIFAVEPIASENLNAKKRRYVLTFLVLTWTASLADLFATSEASAFAIDA